VAGQRLNMGGASAYIDHADAVGSTTMETDPAGAVQWDVTHYPWGRVFQEQGTRQSEVVMGLDWQVNDPAIPSATREYNFRDYRWMTPDPEGGYLENPQTLNKYTYAGNNPTSLNDPSGLDFKEQCRDESENCHKLHWWSRHRYVGSYDQHHHFQVKHFQTDENGKLAGGTINFDKSGVHINGNRAEFIPGTPATRVNGSGVFLGMHAVFNSNCGGTCDAGRLLFGTRAQFQSLLGKLVGPDPGLDPIDVFHMGTTQYRGGNAEGPDVHLSYGMLVNGGEAFHIDTSYPYVDLTGGVEHLGGVIHTFGNLIVGEPTAKAPQDIPSVTVPQ
jgi:RHS repeat-associated protein